MTSTALAEAPTAAPPRQARSRVLVAPAWGRTHVRAVGTILLALQLVANLAWTGVVTSRFAVTRDFGIYYQAAWLIAHGNFDPFSTLMNMPFWQQHGEFIMWPIALLLRVWPNPLMFGWIQCVFLAAAEWVAFMWLSDIAFGTNRGGIGSRNEPDWWGWALAVGGLVLLLADPWIYWAVSFLFHAEPVGVLFLLLVGWELYRDPTSKRIWVWTALALLCGDVVTTYLGAVGLGAMVASRSSRRGGAMVMGAAIGWSVVLTIIGAHGGSNLFQYSYLATGSVAAAGPAQFDLRQVVVGILRHPLEIVKVLWDRGLDIYAKLGASGTVGILSPWAVAVVVLLLLENALDGNGKGAQFVAPGFQDIALLLFMAIGTVHVVRRLGARSRYLGVGCLVLAVCSAIGWGAVWIPQTPSRWLRVSDSAASTLASVRGKIPGSAEVIASQGVAGQFGGRRWIYVITGPADIPVRESSVWVIVAPSQGIETATVKVSDGLIAELGGSLHARLVAQGAGVWAFRWTPPRGVHALVVPTTVQTVGAWSAVGSAGHSVVEGPSFDWRAVSNGHTGYVVSGDYWREEPGRYVATVALASTGPVNVEVWNTTGNVLLARRSLPGTNGMTAVTLTVDAMHAYPVRTYSGAGPFQIMPLQPLPGDDLEIRVWTPAGNFVSVASVELARATG